MIGTVLGGGPLGMAGMYPLVAAPPNTYGMLVDWGNTGAFAGAYANVTSDLLFSVKCTRGRDRPHPLIGRTAPGTMVFTLRNDTLRYSSQNPSSPLYGSVEVGRLVQWLTIYGVRWTGYISNITPSQHNGLPIVTIEASGVLSRIAGKRISPAADPGSATGTVLGSILTAAGFSGSRHLDAGQSTTSRWYVTDKDAFDAVREIEDTELGWLKEDRDGGLTFEDRSHRLQGAYLYSGGAYWDDPEGAGYAATSTFGDGSGTFGDGTFGTSPVVGRGINPYMYIGIDQLDSVQYLINDATGTVTPYTVAGLAVLWTLTDSPPALGPGASVALIANYPNPGAPSGAYVDAWTTPVVGTDITLVGVSNSDIAVAVVKTATQMKITITNNHATLPCSLSLVQARGTAVVKGTPTSVNAQDSASQDKYGLRSYRLPSPWLQNTNVAMAYVASIISSYKGQRPSVRVKFLANMGTLLFIQLLTQDDLSSRRTIIASRSRTGLNLQQDFFIERIEDVYDIERNRYEITYELSQVGPETAVGATNWIIGTNVLDSTTYLA